LLLNPKWDGTLPPYPKKRERRLCLERVVMLSLMNSPQEEQLFLKAFNDTIIPELTKRSQ
jgi:hypothetical protein